MLTFLNDIGCATTFCLVWTIETRPLNGDLHVCLLVIINVDPKSLKWIPSHGPVRGQDLEPDLHFWFGILMPDERLPTDWAVMVIALEPSNASWACFLCVHLPVHAQRRGRVRCYKTDAALEHVLTVEFALLYPILQLCTGCSQQTNPQQTTVS